MQKEQNNAAVHSGVDKPPRWSALCRYTMLFLLFDIADTLQWGLEGTCQICLAKALS